MDDDQIPIVETYRGVGIHDFQPRGRVEKVVKPAIDEVFGIIDPAALVEYAKDSTHPPEARLFAADRAEAAWQLAAEGRALRPTIRLDYLRAATAGLDTLRWIDPNRYTSLLSSDFRNGVPRETTLTEEQCGR